MKIALAQINPTIGDFTGNCDRISRAAGAAAAAGASLTVFSEMCVMGYPARDLLEKPAFIDAQDKALQELARTLKTPVLLGFVQRRSESGGRALYNSCALIEHGKFTAVGHKSLLPSYDVFDEDRYFEPARNPKLAVFNGIKWGLTICEDCWNDKDFWRHGRKYTYDPVDDLAARGAQVLINLSASPFSLGKNAVKESMLSDLARKHAKPLIYVNQVGGNDDLVFDGRSLAFDAKGQLIARGPAFCEGLTFVDLDESGQVSLSGGSLAEPLSHDEEIRRALVLGTRDYACKCGFKSAVLGLSGGIDSALVATLAAEALGPENVTGVAMPSKFNAPESLADAKDLAERLNIHFHVAPIEDLAVAFKHSLSPLFAGRKEDVAEENIQARIRGVLMMGLSNKFGHLLLTTGNKSEMATGYCTLYGDMAGGLAVISDLYKTMVYRLSSYLNAAAKVNGRPPIPESSIIKAPTAELRYNQKDQDSLPPYDVLDGILKASIEELKSADEIVKMGYDAEIVRKTMRLITLNEYKRRQAPPGLKITSKAFGTGRRMPIAQKFREF